MRSINKILIANRGEIALRVIRTATDMGIASVAVYADQDIAAPFAQAADEAWGLGGSTLESTYLDGEQILAIALEVGADAIHPGYGFLSEDASFARAVEDAGQAWIGPSGDVIEALGDKIHARQVAESVGVRPVPGISEPITTRADVDAFIAEHGFPIVIKRTDGGGGRGISVLRTPLDVDAFFARHAPESSAPVEDGELQSDLGVHFIERFVEIARHVETQCARDRQGTFHVVSTRDCSVQRRNQKLIEEAPAPFLPKGVEETLTDWSHRLFEAVDYVGVGTCEFLLEPDGSLWFLEVNPRLQVEHPVSEEVAGIDLVREQIRIAEGLTLSEPEPARGHSFEFRITSEDPAQGLTPTTGCAQHIHWPSGPGVRLELGLAEGDEVQTAFDSMLAKIVVTGADRAQALARSRRALDEFALEGVATPVPVYQDILEDPAFIGVDGFGVFTKWLETRFLPVHDYSDGGEGADTPLPAHIPRETYVIELDGRRMKLSVPSGLLSPSVKARPVQPLRSARQESRVHSTRSTGSERADGTLISPMQAIVVRIDVTPGAHVEEGQLMVVLEAMKMEKYILAPHTGTIADVLTSQGASVAAGDPLVRLEKESA